MFASWEGNLDRIHVRRLFSHRSLVDRTVGVVGWTLAAAFIFGLTWLMGAGARLPLVFRWILSSCLACGMVVVGIVQQFGAWHARRWLRWNSLLVGKYRVRLEDGHVDVKTSRFAMRFPYGALALIDSGLSCVRLGFDATAFRAILLSVADCQPPWTIKELQAFVKERRREGKKLPIEAAPLSEQELPVPLAMQDESPRLIFRGALRQGDLLQTLEADDKDAKGRRVRKWIYILLGVCFVVLLILMSFGLATGRELELEAWTELIFLGIFLLIVIAGAVLRRTAKSDIQADPDAEAGRLDGWLSPIGVGAHYRRDYTAITWAACDSVEITNDRILARFWHGDFLLIGRHMFSDGADFTTAQAWASAAAKPVG